LGKNEQEGSFGESIKRSKAGKRMIFAPPITNNWWLIAIFL
jgi:hypothetical protein